MHRTLVNAQVSVLAASLGLVTSLLLSACGAPDEEPSGGTSDQSITGGAPTGDPVVLMARSRSYCTGTKIGRRRFLTAAHCVTGLRTGNTISVTNSPNGTLGAGDAFTVDKVFQHPSWNVVLAAGAPYDVALVDLTADTPNIPTASVDSSVFADGAKGTLFGYGCDATDPSRAGTKQQADLTALAQSKFPLVTADQAQNLADEYAHWIANRSLGIQLCPGDSGGPLMRVNGSATVVSGVNNSYLFGTDASGNSVLFSLESRTYPVRNWIANPTINNFVSNTSGNFINYSTAECIGISGASQNNGASAAGFYCDGRINQSWRLVQEGTTAYFVLHNNNSGRCMGVSGSSKSAGAVLGQFGCDGKLNQDWQFVLIGSDTYEIVNRNSGLCMGVPGGTLTIGTQLAQFPCDGSPSQQWVFTP